MTNIHTKIWLAVSLVMFTLWHVQSSAQDNGTILDSEIIVTLPEKMIYPPIPRQANVEGIVVVKVKLDDAGKVVSANALSGNSLLVPNSVANALKWRFQPNTHKAAIVVYEFRLSEKECEGEKGEKSRFVYRKPNFAVLTGCAEHWQP
jgi:hypothetical protein